MVYLDNAASTPMSTKAIDVMTKTMATVYANPSSIHTYGREAAKIIRQARNKIADLLQVSKDEIIFTSGGTEGNNTAILGYALANMNTGKHIISTSIEHHSVLHTLDYLREKFDFEITLIEPDLDGHINPAKIEEALRDDTILVSTMYANNEIGYILPIEDIGAILKNHQASFHVDAVQVIGKISVNPKKLGIDFMTASAHKFHGPKGVGFLYANSNKFDNLLHGGDQEDTRRAGTENTPAITSMAYALTESYENLEEDYDYITNLKNHFFKRIDKLNYYSNEVTPSLAHIVNIGFPGYNHDLLLMKLDLVGIAISAGSACTAGANNPSHVLASIYGKDSPRLQENIRISFSNFNSLDDIDFLADKLIEIIGE